MVNLCSHKLLPDMFMCLMFQPLKRILYFCFHLDIYWTIYAMLKLEVLWKTSLVLSISTMNLTSYWFSDLADWLGVEENGLFNFKPSVRPVPLEVHIQVRDVTSSNLLCKNSGCLLMTSYFIINIFVISVTYMMFLYQPLFVNCHYKIVMIS